MRWPKHLVWLKQRHEFLILERFALGVGVEACHFRYSNVKPRGHANTVYFTFVLNSRPRGFRNCWKINRLVTFLDAIASPSTYPCQSYFVHVILCQCPENEIFCPRRGK